MTDYSAFYTDEFLREHHAMLQALTTPPGFTLHCGFCGRPMTVCACGPTPAPGAPTPAAPVPAGRFVTHGGYEVCEECGYTRQYCRGHSPSDPPAQDGASSDLSRRIAEARAKVGGR